MSQYALVYSSDPEGLQVPLKDAETIAIKQTPQYKLYKKRWIILCLFVLFSICNLVQWIQYSIIADVIVRYYGISYAAADLSSLIFLLLYIPFTFPSSYLLDKWGLRVAVLIGMAGTCIGAWIKVGSVAPDRYWILLIGQAFVAIFEVFILPIPPKLAAVWFGSNEVSSACSIGVFGIQLGVAIGFLTPPLLIDSQGDTQAIEEGLYRMAISVAVINTILMVILFVFFQAEPPTPPSPAQKKILEKKSESGSFIQSLKNLTRNRSYMLLFTAYSINCGLNYTISILLNQIVLKYHPNASKHAGAIGLTNVACGMVGSVSGGILLDKFGRYKETTLVTYTMSIVAMIVFTFAIRERIELVYFASGLLGFSITAIVAIGLELGVELTYPEPEGTSGGLQIAGAQVIGVLLTYLYSFLFNNVGDIWANLAMCIALLIGDSSLACIKYDLRRRTAQTNKSLVS